MHPIPGPYNLNLANDHWIHHFLTAPTLLNGGGRVTYLTFLLINEIFGAVRYTCLLETEVRQTYVIFSTLLWKSWGTTAASFPISISLFQKERIPRSFELASTLRKYPYISGITHSQTLNLVVESTRHHGRLHTTFSDPAYAKHVLTSNLTFHNRIAAENSIFYPTDDKFRVIRWFLEPWILVKMNDG